MQNTLGQIVGSVAVLKTAWTTVLGILEARDAAKEEARREAQGQRSRGRVEEGQGQRSGCRGYPGGRARSYWQHRSRRLLLVRVAPSMHPAVYVFS